nr:G protein-coupled receptor [Proales similis]
MSNLSELSQDELSYVIYSRLTANLFTFYTSITVMPIGLVLNLISAIVFLRPSLNKDTNMGFLSAVLCGFNFIALASSMSINLMLHFKFDILGDSSFSCKFFRMWKAWSLHFSSFQQVLVSLDVYIAVSYPGRFKRFRTKRSYAKLITLLVVLTFLANSINLFSDFTLLTNLGIQSFNISSDELLEYFNSTLAVNYTLNNCSNSMGLDLIADVINILLRNLIPFIVMLVLNSLMIRNFFRSKKIIGQRREKNRDHQFVFSILAMNFLFLVIYTPWSVAFIISQVYDFVPSIANAFVVELLRFYTAIANGLAFINNFSIFFTSLAFNVLFRSELVQALNLKRKAKVSSTASSNVSYVTSFPKRQRAAH